MVGMLPFWRYCQESSLLPHTAGTKGIGKEFLKISHKPHDHTKASQMLATLVAPET